VIGFQCDEPSAADVAVRYLRHEIADLARDYRAAADAGKNVRELIYSAINAFSDRQEDLDRRDSL
jgi:hypothetical protein